MDFTANLPPELQRFIATLPPRMILWRNAWLGSHIATLLFFTLYSLTAIKIPPISIVFYTIADLAIINCYSAVMVKTHFFHGSIIRNLVPFSQAIRSENFHLLLLAGLWMITPCQFFKLLPFAIYSFLNISQYLLTEILNPRGIIYASLAPLIFYIERPLMNIASLIDLLLFPIIFIQGAINGSFYAFLIFFAIWCLKLEFSHSARRSVHFVLNLLSQAIMQPTTPPNVVATWLEIRSFINQLLPLGHKDEGWFVPVRQLEPVISEPRRRRKHKKSHHNAPFRDFDDNSSILLRAF